MSRVKGIEGLAGLGWIASFMGWSAAFRLPFITSLVLIVIAVPLAFGADFNQAIQALISLIMTGALLAVLVILATGAEKDLNERGGEALIDDLTPSSLSARIETGVGLLFGLGTNIYFSALFVGDPTESLELLTAEYYSNTVLGNIMLEWLVFLALMVTGLLIVHLIGFCRRQIALFDRWANEFAVDLMHTDECQVFTLQPMRYLLITVIYISLNIIVYQILSALGEGDAAFVGQMPLVVVMVICVIPFIHPVSVIRDRIAEVKQKEISAVRQALAGDRSALGGAQIAHIADEFAAPDLMMYEQYVKDIWEWPIQGYVQRLVFYVLLPPLAWVLAALVEQMVDSYVG